MAKRRLLAGILTAALLVGNVSQEKLILAAGTGADMVMATEESVVKETEPDENGFVIEDGVLVSYKGAATDVVIPDKVTCVGDFAFACSNSLESVVFPESVTQIGENAFDGCESLGTVTLQEGLTKIGKTAFIGCKSLKEICIPKTVDDIGSYVFMDCENLENINVVNSNTTYSSENGILYDKKKV